MEVAVNKSEWEGLSADERSKIEAIISSHFKGTKITGTAEAKASKDALQQTKPQAFNLSNPFCTAACGVAEAAAVAACAALSGGVAIAVCVAAAHEAGNFCRSKC